MRALLSRAKNGFNLNWDKLIGWINLVLIKLSQLMFYFVQTSLIQIKGSRNIMGFALI